MTVVARAAERVVVTVAARAAATAVVRALARVAAMALVTRRGAGCASGMELATLDDAVTANR